MRAGFLCVAMPLDCKKEAHTLAMSLCMLVLRSVAQQTSGSYGHVMFY
jgi:hypothetical protein